MLHYPLLPPSLPWLAAPQAIQAMLPASSSDSSSSSQELKQAAVQWGEQQGMSVRSAATFVRSCVGP